MIATTVAIAVLLVTLAVFAAIGFRARGEDDDVEDYVLARNSQRASVLGLSFFASGLGAWILFAPPELGYLVGLDAVVGYALAAGAPIVLIALVGPALRRIVPSGHGLTEFLRVRFGAIFSTFVAVVSVLYMGVFITAELLAVGSVAALLADVPTWLTVLAVALATLAYTAYGGLRASLVTDRWQSWLVIALLAVAGIGIIVTADAPGASLTGSGLLGVDAVGVESALTLVIAVTAANLFHQGLWQRVWAAADDRALRRGAMIGVAVTVPVVFVAGLFGVLAAGLGVVDASGAAVSVFALVTELPWFIVAAVLVLGVALVASSVDTLENGLAALVVAERPTLDLGRARLVTLVVMIPCTLAALVATSVLQLFLIADLLAAAIVAPSLLGLWPRANGGGALAGGIAGLLGAVGAAWVAQGSFAGAVDAVTFADSVPTLWPFVGALVASALVTIGVSLAGPRAQPGDLDEAVRARATAGA